MRLLSAPKFSDRGVSYAMDVGTFTVTEPAEVPEDHWQAMGPLIARKVRLRLEGQRVRQHLGQLVWVTDQRLEPFDPHWSCRPVPMEAAGKTLCWVMVDSPSLEPGKLRYRAALKELEARGMVAAVVVEEDRIRVDRAKVTCVRLPHLGTILIRGNKLIPRPGKHQTNVAEVLGLTRLGHNMRRQDAPGNYRMLAEAVASQLVGRPADGWQWSLAQPKRKR
ncbi:hypothetical protein TSH7_10115 [Azospirillum sp. TSH7]|nr:hypothetical protein TSH20_19210 [Azospirillum sp. TSH20]PWC64884.1 hypothetical protein TSH7_10115 [Azospirillum sp. TSH7]